MGNSHDITQWISADQQVFWGNMSPADHVVQVYENDDAFLDLLQGFVTVGLKNLECVVILATPAHTQALVTRLHNNGFNVNRLAEDDQLILLDAAETLNKFMINEWPDEKLFIATISEVFSRADKRQRQTRAFGEMVALTWNKGLKEATLQLENLWNQFCAKQKFSLFCAYPAKSFTGEEASSVEHICQCHSKIISGKHQQEKEILYKTVY